MGPRCVRYSRFHVVQIIILICIISAQFVTSMKKKHGLSKFTAIEVAHFDSGSAFRTVSCTKRDFFKVLILNGQIT